MAGGVFSFGIVIPAMGLSVFIAIYAALRNTPQEYPKSFPSRGSGVSLTKLKVKLVRPQSWYTIARSSRVRTGVRRAIPASRCLVFREIFRAENKDFTLIKPELHERMCDL